MSSAADSAVTKEYKTAKKSDQVVDIKDDFLNQEQYVIDLPDVVVEKVTADYTFTLVFDASGMSGYLVILKDGEIYNPGMVIKTYDAEEEDTEGEEISNSPMVNQQLQSGNGSLLLPKRTSSTYLKNHTSDRETVINDMSTIINNIVTNTNNIHVPIGYQGGTGAKRPNNSQNNNYQTKNYFNEEIKLDDFQNENVNGEEVEDEYYYTEEYEEDLDIQTMMEEFDILKQYYNPEESPLKRNEQKREAKVEQVLERYSQILNPAIHSCTYTVKNKMFGFFAEAYPFQVYQLPLVTESFTSREEDGEFFYKNADLTYVIVVHHTNDPSKQPQINKDYRAAQELFYTMAACGNTIIDPTVKMSPHGLTPPSQWAPFNLWPYLPTRPRDFPPIIMPEQQRFVHFSANKPPKSRR